MSKERYHYNGEFPKKPKQGWGRLQSINPEISGLMFPTVFNAMNSKEWVESGKSKRD